MVVGLNTKSVVFLDEFMKADKVFILMLVILLPLTGCIDVSDNADAQQDSGAEPQAQNQTVTQPNHHPVIFGTVAFGDYWHSSNSSTSSDVLVARTSHAVDFDGNVVEFGIDTNQDGVIDMDIDQSSEGADWKMVNGSDSDDWKSPLELDTWGTGDVEYCYQWLSIIAIDDDGDITVEPFMISFDYDDENDMCLMTN